MSKIIQLSKNLTCLVDDEDYEYLSGFSWCAKQSGGNKFYAVRRNPSNGRHIYMHKEILSADGMETDHINGNSLDNRRENLRLCSHAENQRNTPRPRSNTTGYKGVYYNKRTGKYQSYIKKNKKHIYLGQFDNASDAADAYGIAASKLFGDFARTS